jgi:hypothetical protein
MSHNTHHENEEKNDFNTVSDMPWFRPWILVAFLALVIAMLVRGCKETFKYETLTVTAAPDANTSAHGEHNEVKITPPVTDSTITTHDTLTTVVNKDSI